MKDIKRASLVACALAACAALAAPGSASATVLCKTNTTPCSAAFGFGAEVAAHQVFGTLSRFEVGFATISCNESEVKGSLSGSAISVTTLTFGSCSDKVKAVAGGVLDLSAVGMNGFLESSGATIEVEALGINCKYGTLVTNFGSYRSTEATGGNPKLVVSALLDKIAGSFLCTDPAPFTAEYVETSPASAWLATS
jgi:hypothetical protein